MESTQNSFSELIDKFILLQNNALAIISKINEAVISDNENITFTLKDMNDNETTYNFPSFGFMKENFNRIDNTLKSLMGIGDGETIMLMPDGTYKRVITADLAKEPDDIQSLSVPANFGVKPNWFFESFLSPYMYVTFDVSRYIEQSAKRISCKRVITVCDSIEKETYFDLTYKGKNDIDIDALYSDLSAKGIIFYEDEEVKDLPLSVLHYEGNFDVIDIKDVKTVTTSGVEKTTRQYVLNKLTYNDIILGIENSQMVKIGDKIVTGDTLYEITAVDSSTNAVSLKRLSGYDTISIGANVLRFYSDIFAPKSAEVGVSFNERQVIFFKAIEETNSILAKHWSPGVGLFTNDLIIKTTAGEQNLKTFYNDNVLDFSRSIMSLAKEKTVPSIYGEIPNVPSIDINNFKVMRINDHLFDAKEQEEIKKRAADKVTLGAEIKQLDASIEQNKQILGNTNFKTDQERNAVKNKLDSLISEKTAKSSLYASIVTELTTIAKDYNVTFEKPKYRARAFFDIPQPKLNDFTGPQEVIQFEYAYRYLRLDDKPAVSKQIEYTSSNNQIKRGTFSPWVYVKSDIRKRYYDYTLGIYKWENENIEDPDVVNINQVDIPINKGEKVEVRIRSYSEAGWPINPIISEWSPSVIIQFPDDLFSIDEAELAIEQALSEESQVRFEETLRSKNIDLHLETSTQTGDKYIAHSAEQISSGFFDAAGLVINMYEKIKLLESDIKEMKNKLEQIKGEIRVSIVEDGTKTVKTLVKNGSIVDLFAGYYSDYIDQLSSNEKKGAIVTKVYKLMIENIENSPLELVSLLPGGLSERLPEITPTTNPDVDYFQKLMYWEVPVNNLAVSAEETKNSNGIYAGNVQSRQLKSQFLYARKKNIGLVTDLYKSATTRAISANVIAGSGPSWVWNGQFAKITYAPLGNGELTDFCIHTDCPILKVNNVSDWTFDSTIPTTTDVMYYFNTPIINLDTSLYPIAPMRASAFRHSTYFNLQASETDGTVQLNYIDSWPYDTVTGLSTPVSNPVALPFQGTLVSSSEYRPIISELPDKLGFYPHDRYLIGKNTCGSYLFIAPSYFDQILVDGTDYRATRDVSTGEQNAIVIPIIFQFRMVDYYGDTSTSGIIGGYDTNPASAAVKNLVYTKKMGFDVYVKDETRFSFDINVTAKYSKKTQAEKTEITQNVSQKPTSIKANKSNLSSL